MEPWIGAVSALAGVALAGGLSLIGGTLTRRHDRRERRFEMRRDAYASFSTAAEKTLIAADDFVGEFGRSPDDMGIEDADRAIWEPLATVVLVGPDYVVAAAQELQGAIQRYGTDPGSIQRARDAQDAYVKAVRRALSLEE